MGLGIKTRFLHWCSEKRGLNDWFGSGAGYQEWQQNRIITMLNHYGHGFFKGKSIIELGAGFGDIGRFFHILGANVTFIEGREENVAEIKRRYRSIYAIQHDLNKPLPDGANKADMIIHFGLLYHLADPESSLRNTCRACTHMVLETECCDSDDPHLSKHVSENAWWRDHSLDGEACSPSPAFVERILAEEGMEFERVTDARCNGGAHFYDWPLKNTGETRKGQRRFWFVKRKHGH